jgi:hypothetical protein
MVEDVAGAVGAGAGAAAGAGLAGAVGAGVAVVAGAADIASVDVDFLRFFFLLVVSVAVWATETVDVATDKPKAIKTALAKIFRCFFIFFIFILLKAKLGCTGGNSDHSR